MEEMGSAMGVVLWYFIVSVWCSVAAAHPSCMDYTEGLARRAARSPWQCMDCKTCNVCNDSGDAVRCHTATFLLWVYFYLGTRIDLQEYVGSMMTCIALSCTEVYCTDIYICI